MSKEGAPRALRTRAITADDADRLSLAFAAIGWSRPPELFHAYHRLQETGERWMRVAEWEGEPVGYVTLAWRAEDPVLRESGIPEILDLNVLPSFRRRGIGGALLVEAEAEAARRGSTVGLRVGLHSGYGAAQRLYVSRGYLPDGSGAVVDGAPVPEGAVVPLDDDVTLRMTKTVVAENASIPGPGSRVDPTHR